MDSNQVEIDNGDRKLKRLGFVNLIAIRALVCASNLYEHAKQNSGPLKSTVTTVENAVTAVVGPVYEKFKGVPSDLLFSLDDKVDEAANKLAEHAPPSAKQAVCKAHSTIQKATHIAQTLVQETHVGGPFAGIHYAGTLFTQLFLGMLVRVWYVTNQITSLHVLVQMAFPSVTLWSEKYNRTIADMMAKGYTSFRYFPEVPIEEIAKAYKQIEAERGPACAPCAAEKESRMD